MPCFVSANISLDDIDPQPLNTTFDDIKVKLGNIFNFVRWIGVAICSIMLVYCAVKFATSAGNPQKKMMAMESIKNVLVALAILGGLTLISSIAYGLIGNK